MFLFFIVLAAMFGFVLGFDLGVIADALPLFAREFSLSSSWQGVITGALPFGAVLGVISVKFAVDAYGRKPVLLVCSAALLTGALVCSFSPDPLTLLIGRMLTGAGIGASALVAPMYLAEIAPTNVRGAAVTCYQLMITAGILGAYLADWGLSHTGSWRLMFAVGAVPGALCLLGMLKAQESPRWLVLRGKVDQARHVFRLVQPGMDREAMDRIVAEIRYSHPGNTKSRKWTDLFRPPLLGVTAFAAMAFVFQQFSGINVVLSYGPKIFENAGFSGASDQFFATTGLALINLLGSVITILLIDRLGRRPLFLTGFIGSAVFMSIVAFSFLFPDLSNGLVLVAAMLLFILFYSISIGPLPWVYMSELFPLAFRGAGMAIASVANWGFFFLVVSAYPDFARLTGFGGTFAFFAFFCLIGSWYAWRFAPETSGVELEQVEDVVEKDGPENARSAHVPNS
ncbi:sugar porter family MFS transporter [Roseibium sp. RKSG952]|uniref:sugar porter family MFS transporter n=1 Tax=Roseibium sp. RKSG952 TaxID=2529384 RepID=UPI0012BC2EC1|nr:sugar porter family MFS transporter [Roseibium sp. RKSG952]MTH98049.1 sugar porter family MFS transporter [Roseibium sp. RKSG952]